MQSSPYIVEFNHTLVSLLYFVGRISHPSHALFFTIYTFFFLINKYIYI